jgi:hypothetical protein
MAHHAKYLTTHPKNDTEEAPPPPNRDDTMSHRRRPQSFHHIAQRTLESAFPIAPRAADNPTDTTKISPTSRSSPVTVTVTAEEDASMRRLIEKYASAATQTDDPALRESSAFALGMFKYADEIRLRAGHQRNATETGELRMARARLAHLNAFIDEADLDNLRRVTVGMLTALERFTPRHESQFVDEEHDDLIVLRREPGHTLSLIEPAHRADLEALQAEIVRLRFVELIEDFTQTVDQDLRDKASRNVGALKHTNERDLRLFNYQIARERRMVFEARDDLKILDAMIHIADADQSRNILAGIADAITA